MKKTLLALIALSSLGSNLGFACTDGGGDTFAGYICEYHCTADGPLLKTKLSCTGWADPYNDPLLKEMQDKCGGDPDHDSCYTQK